MTDEAPEHETVERPLHLVWNGAEYVDARCGCRYHPDDDNHTHGGGPHVHPCEQHGSDIRARAKAAEVRGAAREQARLVAWLDESIDSPEFQVWDTHDKHDGSGRSDYIDILRTWEKLKHAILAGTRETSTEETE